jgi:hypothetical protein
VGCGWEEGAVMDYEMRCFLVSADTISGEDAFITYTENGFAITDHRTADVHVAPDAHRYNPFQYILFIAAVERVLAKNGWKYQVQT